MKLSTLKQHLNTVSALNFVKPDRTLVPEHFHITEAGLITKHFIDCGGTVRQEKTISFQVWVAHDIDHRLDPKKLLNIISEAEKLFENEDIEIEIEYQSETIGKYGLDFQGGNFVLTTKQTNCLAKDNCGIPEYKLEPQLAESGTKSAGCTPGGGCC